MLDSNGQPCYTTSTPSEPANARLRDCNIASRALHGGLRRVRTGQRPIEGLQPGASLDMQSRLVRTGQRPIEGLQLVDTRLDREWVRTGQRPIEGLQPLIVLVMQYSSSQNRPTPD